MSMMNDAADLTVFPTMTVDALGSSWAIHDPVGITTTELDKLGFTAPSVAVGDDLAGVDVLVIGTRVLTETSRLPATPSDIARGLRVVVFEQPAAALQTMGFRTDDIMPRYVFPRVAAHPVLAGVEPSHLVNWRGAGALIPPIKRNHFPYPDTRMHWGNRGSVASVVIETPHQGAFTPICESSFDLAYSPLLEWRHGAGTVLFCQLDVTGRIGIEPAAELVVTNILRYLDTATLSGPAADRELAFVGSDTRDLALLGDLGLALRHAGPGDLGVQPGEIVVIGRDAAGSLPVASRQQLAAHVHDGGTVVFLPRTSAELSSSSWPSPVTTASRRLARVLPSDPYALLTRGMGPQLTHWRTYLDLDLIAEGGLLAGSQRHLDGLVGRIPDGAGQWLVSQFDWRGLDAGSNNTRRPRWNARKFYRQLLTNLGAASRPSVAAGLLPEKSRAPMVVIGPWRAAAGETLSKTPRYAPGGYLYRVLDGMDAIFHADPWPAAVEPDWGTVVSAGEGGLVDLAPLVAQDTSREGPVRGQTAYARTYVFSAVERTATFAFGTGYWAALRVNGAFVVDDSIDGNVIPAAPMHPTRRVGTRLRAGWNRLDVVVCAGFRMTHYGAAPSPDRLAFSLHGEDPGDLVVAAETPDSTGPPAGMGAAEHPTAPIDFYVEPKPLPEDVYRYHIY